VAMLTFRPVPRHAARTAAGSKVAARGPHADPFEPLSLAFYRRPAEEVGRGLLGRYLVRRLGGERLVLRLVEGTTTVADKVEIERLRQSLDRLAGKRVRQGVDIA